MLHVHVIILVGGNDCAGEASIEECKGNYEALIRVAKEKACNVNIITVCPRADQEVQLQIDMLNDELEYLCQTNDCTLIRRQFVCFNNFID